MTQPTPANDNAPRPDWYDKAIIDHRPLLVRMALHRVRSYESADLINDTIVLALRKWAKYDDNYSFGTWLGLLMDNVMTDRRVSARRMKRTGVSVNIDDVTIPARPEQEDAIALSEVIGAFPVGREGVVMRRRLLGDEQKDIAVDLGVSSSRVQQLEARGIQLVRRSLMLRKVVRRMKDAA